MFELESEGIIEVSTIIMLLLELFALSSLVSFKRSLRFWREICGGKAGELAPQGNHIMCHSSYCMMTCWGVRLPGLDLDAMP